MARFVFKNRGRGPSMAEARAKLRTFRDLVIEQQGDSELVVSGPPGVIRQFTPELTGWFSAAVKTVRRPATGAMRHPPVRPIG